MIDELFITINGGANGKLSGKTKWRSMFGIFNSTKSSANGESGSIWSKRACHSYKLSLISSTCKDKYSITNILNKRWIIYWKYRLCSSTLWLYNFFELFHQTFSSYCGIDFRNDWYTNIRTLWYSTTAWLNRFNPTTK